MHAKYLILKCIVVPKRVQLAYIYFLLFFTVVFAIFPLSLSFCDNYNLFARLMYIHIYLYVYIEKYIFIF